MVQKLTVVRHIACFSFIKEKTLKQVGRTVVTDNKKFIVSFQTSETNDKKKYLISINNGLDTTNSQS